MSLLMDDLEWMHRVINFRHRTRLSQEALAGLLGIGRGTVAQWESRATRPYSRAAELFTALEVETGDEEEVA